MQENGDPLYPNKHFLSKFSVRINKETIIKKNICCLICYYILLKSHTEKKKKITFSIVEINIIAENTFDFLGDQTKTTERQDSCTGLSGLAGLWSYTEWFYVFIWLFMALIVSPAGSSPSPNFLPLRLELILF